MLTTLPFQNSDIYYHPFLHVRLLFLSQNSISYSTFNDFQDRVKINSLSMVAEDYSDSKPAATAIYQVIRDRLLKSPRDKILPLVYAIDSILKNARGHYIAVVEQDAGNWIPTVYRQLQEPQKAKLEKVWKTWNDARIFSPESLKAMGRCFDENVSGKSLTTSMEPVAGISRTVRGEGRQPGTPSDVVPRTGIVCSDGCMVHFSHLFSLLC
jgi:hypothetical protein